MHIGDGVLRGVVCAVSGAGSAGIIFVSLKRIKDSDIPSISLMTAGFFVASLIHIKIGPSSVHLVLNGLTGIVLGFASFPAILAALLLQYVMFQHGGITSLGVNAIVMGLPALASWLFFSLFSGVSNGGRGKKVAVVSFICGSGSVLLSAFFGMLFLMSSGREMETLARVIFIAHLPLAVLEGFITSAVVSFLLKVKPSLILSKWDKKPHSNNYETEF